MNKKLWWAGFSLAISLSLSACGEVESCKEGDDGCIGGDCLDGEECQFDLQCLVASDGDRICGKQVGNDFDCGGRECGESQPCDCDDGELCLPGEPDQCVASYCAEPEVEIGSLRGTTPGTCTPMPTSFTPEPEPLTFEEACETRCLQNCAMVAAYCPGETCDYDACFAEATQTECQLDCPGEDVAPEVSLACITSSCVDAMEQTCESFTCPSGAAPQCDNIRCTNTCGFANDRECDDGDLASAQSGACGFGTDCADCGPRGHEQPNRDFGDLCLVDWQCPGYELDLLDQNDVWCIGYTGLAEGAERCVPGCRETECPDGYVCEPIDPDDNRIDMQVRACLPAVCE